MSSLRTSHIPKSIADQIWPAKTNNEKDKNVHDQTITVTTRHGEAVTVGSIDELQSNPEVRRQVGEAVKRAVSPYEKAREESARTLDVSDPDASYPLPPSPIDDYEPAPDLERLYELLFEEYDGRLMDDLHWHVEDARIRFAWKAKGGSSQGKATLGKCVKLSGHARYFSKQADFLIWFAWDHARNFGMTNRQALALLAHELMHIEKVVDDDTGDISYAVKGHDYEVFDAELRIFGAWRDDLEAAVDAFDQLGLGV